MQGKARMVVCCERYMRESDFMRVEKVRNSKSVRV